MNTKKITDATEDGYHNGLNWPDAWETHGKPGGPWVPRNDAQAMMENRAWCEGWEKGHQEKISMGRVNPMRGVDENAQYHFVKAVK